MKCLLKIVPPNEDKAYKSTHSKSRVIVQFDKFNGQTSVASWCASSPIINNSSKNYPLAHKGLWGQNSAIPHNRNQGPFCGTTDYPYFGLCVPLPWVLKP